MAFALSSFGFFGLVVRSSNSVQNLEPEEHEHLSPFIHQPLLAVLFGCSNSLFLF